MKTIEEVRKFFENDRFATENYMVIDSVKEDTATCSMTVCDRHKNAVGNVMGGVYFTLADFTFAVATNHEKAGMVSLSSTIDFHSIAKGEKIICTAEKIKKGRTTCSYLMTLTDENGSLLATVLTTGYDTQRQ